MEFAWEILVFMMPIFLITIIVLVIAFLVGLVRATWREDDK